MERPLMPSPPPVVDADRASALSIGLFVVWSTASHARDQVLSDLSQRFEILRVVEVHWTPALVMRNYRRFYSDLDVRGVYHVLNKGAGPFLAIIVDDRETVLESRDTARGSRLVNARFFDAKREFRERMGGLGVHCGETEEETRRDISMLLGVEMLDSAGSDRLPAGAEILTLHRDLAGTRGWESAADMYRVLNESVAYVALDLDPSSAGGSVELLTDHYTALHTILGARAAFGTAPSEGGRFRVSVAGRPFEFAIRFVGDGFFDPDLSRSVLAGRTLDANGVYRASPRDAFATLAVHVILHQPRPSEEDVRRLVAMAAALGEVGWSTEALGDPPRARVLLEQLLASRGCSTTRPRDPMVYCQSVPSTVLRHTAFSIGRMFRSVGRSAAGHSMAIYYWTRDRVLLRVPWVRKIRRSLRRARSEDRR